MAKVQMSATEYIGKGWEMFTANPGMFIVIVIIAMGINMAASFTYVGGLIIGGPLSVGLAYCALRQLDEGTFEIGDMFQGFKQFLPAMLAGLLVTLFSFVGALLCIIPGIIVGVLYALTYFYLADRKMDFWPAMEASREVVWENFGGFLLLGLLLALLNIAGAMLCGVGLLVTIPMTLGAMASAYRAVTGAAPAAEPAS